MNRQCLFSEKNSKKISSFCLLLNLLIKWERLRLLTTSRHIALKLRCFNIESRSLKLTQR